MNSKNEEYLKEKLREIELAYNSKNFLKCKILAEGLRINFPNSPVVLNILGGILTDLNELKLAKKYLQQSIKIKSNYADAYYNLGNIFRIEGNLKNSKNLYEKAIKLDPNLVQAYNNLGLIFHSLKIHDKALDCFKKSINIDKNFYLAYFNIGNIYHDLLNYFDAIRFFKASIALNPEFSDAYNNLGNVFLEIRQYEEAIKNYKEASNISKDFLKTYGNYLFCLLYSKNLSPNFYLIEAKKYGSNILKISSNKKKPKISKKNKKINVGFVSGDFIKHPVAFYITDTLKYINKKKFKIFAYSNSSRSDSYTKILKNIFDEWTQIDKINDEEVLKKIRSDSIDILFDLSGHTAKNRLSIFKHKWFPMQVSWAGFASTTGLNEIDYVIGDENVTPKKNSSHFSEKIINLPCSWVSFSKPPHNIKISQLPAKNNNYITFGSFNNLSKINNDVLTTWAKILNKIANSKILLKSKQLKNKMVKKEILLQFEKNGISEKSIILEGPSSREELLKSYNRIDVALDTFPYSGGVTTCEALWMGIPVITNVENDKFISLTSKSILKDVGLNSLIAKNKDDYIKKAILISSDLKKLSKIRRNLRSILIKKPSFNAKIFSRIFFKELEQIWKRHK